MHIWDLHAMSSSTRLSITQARRPMSMNSRGDRSTTCQPRLRENVMYMVLDGGQGDKQTSSNLFVAQPLGHDRCDLSLARRECIETHIRRRRHRQPNDDHRLTQLARRLKINRYAPFQLRILSHPHKIAHGQARPVITMHRPYQSAQPLQSVRIERWNMTRHYFTVRYQPRS